MSGRFVLEIVHFDLCRDVVAVDGVGVFCLWRFCCESSIMECSENVSKSGLWLKTRNGRKINKSKILIVVLYPQLYLITFGIATLNKPVLLIAMTLIRQ